jgi:hypothetical protein
MPDIIGLTEPFTGAEEHQIPIPEAAELTRRYRDAATIAGANPVIKGEYFSRDSIQMLLDHPLSVGIRIYYGLKSDSTPCMVICAVEENKNDLLDVVLEMGKICPSHCGVNNPLNT